jgi:hypothetical protein
MKTSKLAWLACAFILMVLVRSDNSIQHKDFLPNTEYHTEMTAFNYSSQAAFSKKDFIGVFKGFSCFNVNYNFIKNKGLQKGNFKDTIIGVAGMSKSALDLPEMNCCFSFPIPGTFGLFALDGCMDVVTHKYSIALTFLIFDLVKGEVQFGETSIMAKLSVGDDLILKGFTQIDYDWQSNSLKLQVGLESKIFGSAHYTLTGSDNPSQFTITGSELNKYKDKMGGYIICGNNYKNAVGGKLDGINTFAVKQACRDYL